jgi:hypothetical protein
MAHKPVKQPRSALRSPSDFDRQDKRQMECEYFTSFRYFEPAIQSENVIHAEHPDFRVDVGGRVIGVEVTQLFKPASGRDVESTQERILEEACLKAQEQNLAAAHVTLFFNLHRAFGSATRSRIAAAVVNVVAKHMPPEGQSIELDGKPGQPHEVDLILVNRVHTRAIGRWGRWEWLEPSTAGDAARVIQARIDSKTEKLSKYLECCNECWLLLAADSFRASGRLAFDTACQSHIFLSPFARTYVLDFGKGHLYSLRTLIPSG